MNDLMLPDPATAALPANYEAAKLALAECVRVDECQDWADKMAALAAYARQIEDKEMENHCRRIQGRAVRRVSELLNEVKPARGNNQYSYPDPDEDGEVDLTKLGRVQAARDAGLSDYQRVTAMRVGNVPDQDFEEALESDNPPTVSQLAERGRRRAGVDLGDRSPDDFAVATKLMGLVTRFVVDTEPVDLKAAMRGFTSDERSQLADRCLTAARLLRDIMEAGRNATMAEATHVQ